MIYETSSPQVFDNLSHFKDALPRYKEERGQERKYSVLLNPKTGEMRFAQKIKEHQLAPKGRKKESLGDWKRVEILVTQKNAHDSAHFDLKVAEGTQLEPLARRIADETIGILNTKAKDTPIPSNQLPEAAVLEDLSSIHINASSTKRIEDLMGWMGSLTREEAEEILENKPLGTYLLREGDKLTQRTAYHLAQENGIFVRPYLLTVVEAEGKVSDILLLHTQNGWTHYKDDPNLRNSEIYTYYLSAQALLDTFNDTATQPLK